MSDSSTSGRLSGPVCTWPCVCVCVCVFSPGQLTQQYRRRCFRLQSFRPVRTAPPFVSTCDRSLQMFSRRTLHSTAGESRTRTRTRTRTRPGPGPDLDPGGLQTKTFFSSFSGFFILFYFILTRLTDLVRPDSGFQELRKSAGVEYPHLSQVFPGFCWWTQRIQTSRFLWLSGRYRS